MLIVHLVPILLWAIQIITCSTTKGFELPNGLDTRNVIVNFNPHVSTLDWYNDSRYGIDDIIPLVSLVSSRFKRVCITVSLKDIFEDRKTSLILSPLAVAKYNCLTTTQSKVEVLLRIGSKYDQSWCNCSDWVLEKSAIESFVKSINDECEETIKTIIKLATNCKENTFVKCQATENHLNLFRQYQWAVEQQYQTNMEYENSFEHEHFHPDIVVLSYSDLDQYFQANNTTNIKQTKSIIHSFGFTDQYNNLSGFISSWQRIFNIQDQMFLVNSAFDVQPPLHFSYKHFSGGWWYLLDDSESKDTKLYKFEEKFAVSNKVDKEETPENFEWLSKEIVFNQQSTGITLFDFIPHNFVNSFCRFFILNDKTLYNPSIPEHIIRRLKGVHSRCKPVVQLLSHNENDLKYEQKPYSELIGNVAVLLLGEIKFSRYMGTWVLFRELLEDFKTILDYYKTPVYGYSLSLEMCGYSKDLLPNKLFMDIIKDPKSSMYLFYYEENEDLVKIGATRLFLRIKVMFQECRRMIFENRNYSTEVAFALQGYFLDSSFYSSPEQLQNYVKYISLLNNWVTNQTNTVLFLGQITDSKYKFRKSSSYEPTVGWFSTSLSKNNTWNDKRQDALEVSLLNFPKSNLQIINKISTLSTTQITIILLSSLAAFCLLVVSMVYFTRRYYANRKLTIEEVEKFLNGETSEGYSNTASSAPYDKEKYEIPTANFNIEDELGSGEYGKVCRGKIKRGTNELSVAIKTSNPKTFHRNAVTGLLSEIKVLAYLGKHHNIVELLGANTENLKNGMVYIFLELCQLGSLDKVLMEWGQQVSSPIVNSGSIETDKKYENAFSSRNKILDSGLSEDLYKWSSEICDGMTYLAQKHVVHADLATRNVLMSINKEAKICDFGLSRRMYNYTNYVKSQQGPIPWKWMAPEALNYRIFSEKSDVWAYGVTLWEIYSLGKSPYPGLTWDTNFAGMLERGLRLSEPEFAERNMYSVMKKCWATDDKHRPTFLEIQELLGGTINITSEIAESVV